MRIAHAAFALICYAAGIATLGGAVLFLAGTGLPRTVDGGGPLLPPAGAALVDTALLAGFGLQHSVMARARFKAWWTRLVPPATERSFYVLASSVALLAVMTLWHPIPGTAWDLTGTPAAPVLWDAYAAGWALMAAASLNIDHWSLFGLRQAFASGGRGADPPFRATWLYALVRHPISLAWLVVAWATPLMTLGHLLFAVLVTAYIAIATIFEEADLTAALGDTYREYRARVPALLPLPRSGASAARHRAEQGGGQG